MPPESEPENVEFNLHDAADELISNEAGAESTQVAQTEGQPATDPANTVSDEQRAQDILNGKIVEEKPAEINQALIDQINSIGAIHNGLPIKVDSPDQLKELLQKGFDYTKKSMAREEEFRVKEEGFSQKEAQFQEREAAYAQKEQQLQTTVYTNQMMSAIIGRMQTEDPELFEHLDMLYRKEEDSYNKQAPFKAEFEGKFNSLQQEIQGLKGQKQQEELGSIKQNWESGLAELQTQRGARLKELGIVPNWDKVKEVYASDASNKMTHEQALLAVHGADMIKMAESQLKTLQLKNKTQSQKLGRGGVGQRQTGNSTTAVKGDDMMTFLRTEADRL